MLVTGASSGLGEVMARLFAKLGYNLAICARRGERLEQLKAQGEQALGNLSLVPDSIRVLVAVKP